MHRSPCALAGSPCCDLALLPPHSPPLSSPDLTRSLREHSSGGRLLSSQVPASLLLLLDHHTRPPSHLAMVKSPPDQRAPRLRTVKPPPSSCSKQSKEQDADCQKMLLYPGSLWEPRQPHLSPRQAVPWGEGEDAARHAYIHLDVKTSDSSHSFPITCIFYKLAKMDLKNFFTLK